MLTLRTMIEIVIGGSSGSHVAGHRCQSSSKRNCLITPMWHQSTMPGMLQALRAQCQTSYQRSATQTRIENDDAARLYNIDSPVGVDTFSHNVMVVIQLRSTFQVADPPRQNHEINCNHVPSCPRPGGSQVICKTGSNVSLSVLEEMTDSGQSSAGCL